MMSSSMRQRGFTLVELMVSMTIMVVAIAAGGALYFSSSQSNRILQMQNILTEDGRFALQTIQRQVTQAGFRNDPGGARGTALSGLSATGFTVQFQTDGANQVNCDGAVIGPGVPNNAQTTIAFAWAGAAANPLTCGGATLVGSAAGELVGSEVIDFRVLYGVDNAVPAAPNPFPAGMGCGAGRDCVADDYGGAPADVNQVVALQVCLVLRSRSTDTALAGKVPVQPLDPTVAVLDCSGNGIANSATDLRLYRTFRSTILLRNL